MNELLVEFQKSLADSGVSRRTCSGYSADVRSFLEAMGPAAPTFPQQMDRAAIERYLEHLTSRGARPATLRRTRAGLRRFFGFLVTRGDLSQNPAAAAKYSPNGGPALSQDEILSIFRFLRLRSREVPPRRAMTDELMLMLMIFVGLRQQHLGQLTRSSIEMKDGIVSLTTRPPAGVVIDGPVRGHLSAYLRRYHGGAGRLFPGRTATRRLLREVGTGLHLELDPFRLYRTHLRLRAAPELACWLLARIEDIHE
jgi:site-specific recombinase XerD